MQLVYFQCIVEVVYKRFLVVYKPFVSGKQLLLGCSEKRFGTYGYHKWSNHLDVNRYV